MPRLTLVAAAAVALITATTPAHAITPYLWLNGCPGDDSATKDGTLACANGSTVAMMVLVAPSLNFADMYYCQTTLQFDLLTDTFASAPYWDFAQGGSGDCPVDATSNVRNMKLTTDKYGTCAGYLNVFGDSPYVNSLYSTSPSRFQITLAKFGSQSGPVVATADQSLFLCSIVFDTDHVGTCAGCASPVSVTAIGAFAEDTSTRIQDTSVGVFDTVNLNVGLVPAQRQSWGRLKQLYR